MFEFFSLGAIKLLAGKALGSAVTGLRAAGGWLSHRSPAQLLAIALALALAYQHFFIVNPARHRATAAETRAKTAEGLAAFAVAQQHKLEAALATQNAAIDRLSKESLRQQNAATEAQKRAAGRVKQAEGTSDRLRSSASHAAPTGVCGPSETLKEQWQ